MKTSMIEEPRKKNNKKLYLAIFALLLLLASGVYGYFQYKSFIKLQESAEIAVKENNELKQKVNEYNELKQILTQEKSRCEKLLLQAEGNFAEFSYCQSFLEFINNTNKNL